MADVLAVRDAYRAQQWEMVVQECAASGLSNREFSRQRGIPVLGRVVIERLHYIC